MESIIDAATPPRRAGARAAAALLTPAFATAVALVLYAGWRARHDGALTPESGAGYALGVAGTAMMALMLLYPARKHVGFMRRWGAMRHWFKAHMLLGIVGPVCILFHCNFAVGSLNAEVALVSMLVVVASGIVGRYLYARIHYGLYGGRATMEELRSRLAREAGRLAAYVDSDAALRARLAALDVIIDEERSGLLANLSRVARTGVATRFAFAATRMRAVFPGARHRLPRDARRLLRDYLSSVRRVAGFAFYERLFALWHVLHVPLFMMLLVTAAAHVVAVHRY